MKNHYQTALDDIHPALRVLEPSLRERRIARVVDCAMASVCYGDSLQDATDSVYFAGLSIYETTVALRSVRELAAVIYSLHLWTVGECDADDPGEDGYFDNGCAV